MTDEERGAALLAWLDRQPDAPPRHWRIGQVGEMRSLDGSFYSRTEHWERSDGAHIEIDMSAPGSLARPALDAYDAAHPLAPAWACAVCRPVRVVFEEGRCQTCDRPVWRWHSDDR